VSRSILLELGWPAKALNPNSREHFMTVSRFKKAARDTAFWVTRSAMGLEKFPHNGERIAFIMTAHPPDNRARDDDNFIASMKAARDGIAQGLGVDDKFFDQRLHWAEPSKKPCVVIEVRG
jgi:crossover junction endodeoxyribonuclease RusA